MYLRKGKVLPDNDQRGRSVIVGKAALTPNADGEKGDTGRGVNFRRWRGGRSTRLCFPWEST